jgi:hypothetical protein
MFATVEYIDVRGTERGPFKLVFAPGSEKIRNGKKILAQTSQAWVSFRVWNDETLAYFSHLVSYRYAIKEIRYSLNSDRLDQVFPLTPPDPHNPHAVTADTQIHITIPKTTRYIAVQVRFADGDTSKVQKFPNRFGVDGATENQAIETDGNAGPPRHSGGHRGGQGGGRLIDNVEVQVAPSFRRAPRVRF